MNNIENNEYVVAALSEHKLLQMDEITQLKSITLTITEVFKFRGQEPNATDCVDMAKSLCRKIVQNGEISPTIPEIRMAFEYGVTGEYGEYFGINYVTLWKWLKAFLWSDDRLEALNMYRRIRKPQNTNLLSEKSESEKQRDKIAEIKNNIRYIFEDIKNNVSVGITFYAQEVAYKYLRQEGFIQKPTEDEIKVAWEKGKGVLENRKNRTSRSILEIIDDGFYSAENANDKQKVIRYATSFLLRNYLEGLDKLPDELGIK